MSIYAANNRMGRASDATVVANESYGANDIGRILYETQVNDQAIFEAEEEMRNGGEAVDAADAFAGLNKKYYG